jgi:hypothetical protein
MKSKHLGGDFVMQNRTCFVCGSFDHFAAYCDNYPWKKLNSRDTRVYGNNQVRVNNNFTNKIHSNVNITN